MSTENPHILLIEDEKPIRNFLRASLVNAGYDLSEASSGTEGLRLAMQQPPDLIVLDLGLPDLDGQEVLLRLREWFTPPIIVLSARDQEPQKIKALDHGADDYVTKPFGIGELLARIRTALRHHNQSGTEATTVIVGDVRFELGTRRVFKRDQELHFTPLEYKLLITLLKHAGKVLTHRFLLREVWGPQDTQENHYLRVFIASIRRKLEDDPTQSRYIITEQGVGYRFAAE